MSHVDDGELTAYADGAYPANDPVALRIGAHLSTCENCRTRLEQAHALRDRAAEVLGYATPARVQAPAFESLEAQLATPTQRRRRPIPLAWAASIIMALGLGWFGRGFWQNPPAGSDVAVREAVRAETQMQSAAPPTAATNQEEGAAQQATRSAAAAAPTPAPVQPPSVAAADVRRERAPERAQAEQDMSDRAAFSVGRAAGNARSAAAPPAAVEAPKVTMESAAAAPVMRGEHITAAEAERRGLNVPRIPELPIARVVLNGDTTAVVHTLPDGRLVTLIATADRARQALAQRDAAAEAGAAAPQMAKTAAPTPIVVRVRGNVVQVTGEVAADSLRKLAGKIR
jgi:hypothetical protein